jgi:DNA-binding NtrC family response regulator
MSTSQALEYCLIVVAEEETTLRQAMARHLQDGGFDVAEAGTTDEALKLLENNPGVRGLVTDAHVPGRYDGFELAELARRRWPAIAVVITSGHSDATSGPIPDGSEFIAKPYLVSRLVPVLNELIGRPA